MRRTSLFAAALVVAVLSAPRVPAQASPPAPVMRIDGQDVPAELFGRWLLASFGEPASYDYARDVFLPEREAARLGVSVSDEDARAAAEANAAIRVEKAFGGKKAEWIDELERTGRTEAGVMRQWQIEKRSELVARALATIDRVVPEDLIVRDWQLRYGRKGRKYEAQLMKFQVVFESPDPALPRDEKEAMRQRDLKQGLDRARAALARVRSGEDFGAVARECSDDPETRASGGALPGKFDHVGWPHNFLEALDALPVGELMDPLYARGGYWIVKKLSEVVTPLEQVRTQVASELVAKGPEQFEWAAVQDRLVKDAKIVVRPTILDPTRSVEFPGADLAAFEIDGQPVPRGPFALWLMHTRGEAMANHFAEQWLVERKAREMGIEVTPQELRDRQAEYVDELVQAQFKGNREAWRAKLASEGRTEDSFLYNMSVRIRTDLLVEKLMLAERTVTEDDVRRAWAERYGEGGEARRVRLLLLRNAVDERPGESPADADARRAESLAALRKRADEFAAQARGGADFAALCRQNSQDETAVNGGEIPATFRPSRWPPDVAAAVNALGLGEVSDAQPLNEAWGVFQVIEVQRTPLEQVRAELEQELRTARPPRPDLSVYRNVLLKQARVELLPAMCE